MEISDEEFVAMIVDSGFHEADLSKELDVSRPTVQRWKSGKNLPHPLIRKHIFAAITVMKYQEASQRFHLVHLKNGDQECSLYIELGKNGILDIGVASINGEIGRTQACNWSLKEKKNVIEDVIS